MWYTETIYKINIIAPMLSIGDNHLLSCLSLIIIGWRITLVLLLYLL